MCVCVVIKTCYSLFPPWSARLSNISQSQLDTQGRTGVWESFSQTHLFRLGSNGFSALTQPHRWCPVCDQILDTTDSFCGLNVIAIRKQKNKTPFMNEVMEKRSLLNKKFS